jgi:hypothetical protein
MARFLSLLLLLSTLSSLRAERSVTVANERDLAVAAQLLATPGAEPLVVRVSRGNYVLRHALHILRSNVTVLGEPGAKFRLADAVNEPVIAIGSQSLAPVETERIRNIRISGIEVDGNRDAQASELDRGRPWIRNNGIDVRMVSRLSIDRVVVTGARSGGLVISWKCADVRVRDCEFRKSFFDGVAYYDSQRIETIRCSMVENRAAGVSADNRFWRSRFIECRMIDNGDVGVFMRSSRDIRFDRCRIERSRSWAVFLAHGESGDGVRNVSFRHCWFIGNAGGVRMASPGEKQSRGTVVSECFFTGNRVPGRSNIDSAGSKVRAKRNQEP